MSFESSLVTSIETAINTVIAALSDGDSVVEYEIAGRRVRREPSSELLERLYKLHRTVSTDAARASKSPFRLARLSRASQIGSS